MCGWLLYFRTYWIWEAKFSPEEALSWIRVGVAVPDQAAAWRGNNIPPAEAREWIRQGIRDPEKADPTKSGK